MAAMATACASTALAGQSLLQPANELVRKVGTSNARVTMRKASSSTSYWYQFSELSHASLLPPAFGNCPDLDNVSIFVTL